MAGQTGHKILLFVGVGNYGVVVSGPVGTIKKGSWLMM